MELTLKFIKELTQNNQKQLEKHQVYARQLGFAPRATIEASSPQDTDGVSLGGRGLQPKA